MIYRQDFYACLNCAILPRMTAILVQPPFVQLNAPYPAIHYLAAFLRNRGMEAECHDHSIELYRRIFSRSGLQKIFQAAREKLDSNQGPKTDASEKQKRNIKTADDVAQREIVRFLSYENLYCDWIDSIIDFLSGADPGMAHRLAAAAELPRGARAQAFLDVRDGRIRPDESLALATAILDDLGDFIAFTLDPEFGTVRYAERIASSRADFSAIEQALDSSWLIKAFYEPYLEEFWKRFAANPPAMLLVTIPFPGSLLGALACARSARSAFSTAQTAPAIIFGGGYVSTELRGLRDTGIFRYCDYLAFDAGFGSLASILDSRENESLYRTMRLDKAGNLAVCGFPKDDSVRLVAEPDRILIDCPKEDEYRRLEKQAIATTFPDYRDADFSRYLRIVDSLNPMHRLWSDTPWLKFSLAHGCYWKKCAFCDTELEYVADYSRSATPALLAAIDKASSKTGLRGIHFVDEAMPMSALLDFAAANRERQYSYWGNVRFDATWTQARCEFLASRGLVAVSGGIEIATERGLQMTGKGFSLAELVKTLVAMRRAGLLIHTYLIYGFPDQPEADIIDSAEFCRQLFVSGLVDSAFWHRFVLTRHSRMYREWQEGKRPNLKPIDRPSRFANNDLSFVGEDRFNTFDTPLAASLSAWMEGAELDVPLSRWFGKKAPRPGISENLAESLIAQAESELDATVPNPKGRAFWIAGEMYASSRGLIWAYRGSLETLKLNRAKAHDVRAIINSPELSAGKLSYSELSIRLALPEQALQTLLSAGLVVV